MFKFITNSMLLSCVLVSITVLTSGSPQNGGNIIFFPEEVNSVPERNGKGLEVFYNNPDDKLWVPGNPDDSYNVESHSLNRISSDFYYEYEYVYDDDSYTDVEPFNFVREEDYFELPDWMDTDLNELSLDKLAVLNNVTDLADLAGFFGLNDENAAKLSKPYNRTQPEMESDDLIVRTSGHAVETNNVLAKFAKCRPEKVTVELAVHKNTLFLPTCVRLQRCGGCCNTPLLQCQPTKVEKFSLIVMKMTNGKRRRRRSRQRRSLGQVLSIPQENHVECACLCKVKETDCDPQLHNYNQGACECVCKKEAEQRKCQKSSKLHKWDNNSCRCKCQKRKECSTGEFFSEDTCRCAVGRA